MESIELHRLLSAVGNVRLWATSAKASPVLLNNHPIMRASTANLMRHGGGTYIFVGGHWWRGAWPWLARRPARLIYDFCTFHPKLVAHTSRTPPGWPKVE